MSRVLQSRIFCSKGSANGLTLSMLVVAQAQRRQPRPGDRAPALVEVMALQIERDDIRRRIVHQAVAEGGSKLGS
jgi:hypothetical protein